MNDDPIHCWSSAAAAEAVSLYFQGDRGECKAILFGKLQHMIARAMEEAVRERLHQTVKFSKN